jgi:ribosomal protein L27
MTTHKPDTDNHFTEHETRLLNLLPKKHEHDVGDLAEALKVSSEEIIRIAHALSTRGYRITYDGARNVIRLVGENENGGVKHPDISEVLNRFSIGVIAEPRIGAKQEQMALLDGVYKEFEHRGVSFVICAGNVTVGKPDNGSTLISTRPDTFLFTPQEQRDFVVKHFPKAGKKIKTYFIAGRRDLTFRGKQGYSIVQDICQRRPDFVYWGDKTRAFDVRGLKMRVMNPYDDNGPDGKTYGVQQIANSLDDPHPDILLVAGMHRFGLLPDYWNDGWGYVCMIPSLHSQMTRQSNKRAPVRPDIGAVIIHIDFNKLDANGKPEVLFEGINLNPYADYSGSEHFEPYPEHDANNLAEEESKILAWLHAASEFGLTIGEVSRRLKKNRKSVESIIAHLQELGYPISIPEDIKRLILKQKIRETFPTTNIEIAKEVEVGAVSDTHLTGNHQQIGLLRRAYDTFGERGIELVFHGGDLYDGGPSVGYRGHSIDMVGNDIHKLRDYVVARYPSIAIRKEGEKARKGKTVGIGGNHDGWIVSHGGLDFVEAVSKERRDFEYLGSEFGYYLYKDIFFYLLHPRGGSGDTRSRKLEMFIKKARNRIGKGKGHPRVMLLGNWHQAIAFFDRDILGFLLPCMKSEDSFHTTLGLVPQLGFWIIRIGLDKDNNIVNYIPEYFGFSEKDIDPWDYTDFHRWEIKQAKAERNTQVER